MSFIRRYPEHEILIIGREIEGLRGRSAQLPLPILGAMKELGALSRQLEDAGTGGSDLMEEADFERDELVRSLALLLKSWAHRRTRRKLSRTAHRLYRAAFGDSYTWISSSYSEESREIEDLLSALTGEFAPQCAEIPGLSALVEDLSASQERFAALERDLAGEGGGLTRDLRVQFHHELDRYISLIDSHLKAYIPAENAVRRILLAPLEAATDRLESIPEP